VAGLAGHPEPATLPVALNLLRAAGTTQAHLALPVPGDPIGLAGPPPFNEAALETGEAVVLTGPELGLVPSYVGPAVQWTVLPATSPMPADLGEADRGLRLALIDAAESLAALDVARWKPEVADALIDIRKIGRGKGDDLAPGYEPRAVKTAATARRCLAIADAALEDDRLIEVSPKGDIVWEWLASDHVDEFGFSPAAREAIKSAAVASQGRGSGPNAARGSFDWLHINAATYVGPNKWFDAGDRRFAPNNIIISSRQSSFVAIVGRDGKIAWRIGPDFLESKELRVIRQIIGQHHPHIIPKGLPGAGNLMVFDNGGSSGYGAPTPVSPDGSAIYQRAGSRVLEINPVTLELVWSFTGARLFSTNISSAQRLPNGNTLITEGAPGRLLEVTSDRQVVWEYIYPVFGGANRTNAVYRGYRVPYDWIPQITKPVERAIVPPSNGTFRVPAAAAAPQGAPVPRTAPPGEIVGVGNLARSCRIRRLRRGDGRRGQPTRGCRARACARRRWVRSDGAERRGDNHGVRKHRAQGAARTHAGPGARRCCS
jgi:hypothetical protein